MEQTNVWAKRAHSRDTRDSGDMKSEIFQQLQPVLNTKNMQSKTISPYENNRPVLYQVLHFIAIAFADNAFYPRLIASGLSSSTLRNLASSNCENTMGIAF